MSDQFSGYDDAVSQWKQAASSEAGASSDQGFRFLYGDGKTSHAQVGFIPLYAKPGEKGGGSDGAAGPVDSASGAAKKQPVPTPADSERQAYREGFSRGEKDGFESGKEKAKEFVDRMAGILMKVEGLWTDLIKNFEKEILQLVCRAAEKVVHGKVAVDQEIVKKAILHAFELIPNPVEVTINVSPEDYEYIETVKEEIFARIKALKHVSIISDPGMDRGGCTISTCSGEVDARLESRLDSIKRSVMETGGNKAKP